MTYFYTLGRYAFQRVYSFRFRLTSCDLWLFGDSLTLKPKRRFINNHHSKISYTNINRYSSLLPWISIPNNYLYFIPFSGTVLVQLVQCLSDWTGFICNINIDINIDTNAVTYFSRYQPTNVVQTMYSSEHQNSIVAGTADQHYIPRAKW